MPHATARSWIAATHLEELRRPIFYGLHRHLQLLSPTIQSCSLLQNVHQYIPIPKKSNISRMNEYRSVALISVDMKVFERFVLKYLKTPTDGLLDLHEFVYQANRSVDDAVALSLHHNLEHLERPGTYARILFIHFSSAFNVESIYHARCAHKFRSIVRDTTHPAHHLFELLPSDKRYRSITRLNNSFYLQAVRHFKAEVFLVP